MCSRSCGTNVQHCGICVPCTYHDNTTSDALDQDMLACPRPASQLYTSPLTQNLRGIGARVENLIEERGGNSCGSYQTDLWAPRTVQFQATNGPMLTCTRPGNSLVNWTLLFTDRDCTPTPTPTRQPTPTRVITLPPPTTITPTRPPTITPTRPVTPTITPTPPTKGKKLVGMQVKTFKNRPARVNMSLGVAPIAKPYITELTLRQLSPGLETTATSYSKDTKQIIRDLAANTDYRFEFCVNMTSGVKYCDTFRAASVGSRDGVHEPITFKTGVQEDKIYSLWISW